jgi:hypothetical protein
MDTTISNVDPTAVALSPVEQLRAKIHDAEKEFARALRTEFKAMSDRADELDEQISEANFYGDEAVRKALGKLLKGFGEIDEILSDLSKDSGTADEDNMK